MTQTDTNEQRVAGLISRAESGDREAQFELGLAYETGDGIDADEKLAALWFKRAAQHEHPEAILKYGDALYYGRGIGKDLNKAFTQYLRGANLGNLGCQFAVGYAYLNGEGVEADEKMAEVWYRRCAELGHADGQLHLGHMYQNANADLPKNLHQAAELYRKSAAQGNGNAMKALGLLYTLTGDDEYDNDPLEALYWFKKGAELGNAKCMVEYGKLLAWDSGIARNDQEAIKWLRKGACILKDAWSAELIALVLHWTRPSDYSEVFYWNARYCLYGSETQNGAMLMAQSYQNVGTPDACSLALYWWNLAVARGVEYADKHIEQCLKLGGTRERARELIAERELKEEDLLCGNWTIPMNTDEPAIWWENFPVPQVVREEMGETFQPEPSPPARTENMERATPDSTQVSQVYAEGAQHASLPNMPVTQLPAGSILAEKYLIEKVLGKGGMAIVFKAKHLMMDRPVAIKMMLPEVSRDAITSQRFQREAMNASMLRHPNVITIYDYGITTEGQPFMVMDYLEGASLEDVLEREGVLPLSRGLSLLTQVCDALGAAHAEGIVHRDIKPSNIMIEQRRGKEHVLLVDFGIAKSLGGQSEQQQKLTKTGEVFGSLIYMSPEQCMGKPLDARSDIYSFGCVFWEVFCGDCPFLGETVFETMTKHIYEDAPIMVPPKANAAQREEMNAIFQKCVAKSPEDRYQTMEEVKDALLAIP